MALAAVAALLLTAGGAGSPNPRLVEQLKRGGLVLVLRHAATDQSKQTARISWTSPIARRSGTSRPTDERRARN